MIFGKYVSRRISRADVHARLLVELTTSKPEIIKNKHGKQFLYVKVLVPRNRTSHVFQDKEGTQYHMQAPHRVLHFVLPKSQGFMCDRLDAERIKQIASFSPDIFTEKGETSIKLQMQVPGAVGIKRRVNATVIEFTHEFTQAYYKQTSAKLLGIRFGSVQTNARFGGRYFQATFNPQKNALLMLDRLQDVVVKEADLEDFNRYVKRDEKLEEHVKSYIDLKEKLTENNSIIALREVTVDGNTCVIFDEPEMSRFIEYVKHKCQSHESTLHSRKEGAAVDSKTGSTPSLRHKARLLRVMLNTGLKDVEPVFVENQETLQEAPQNRRRSSVVVRLQENPSPTGPNFLVEYDDDGSHLQPPSPNRTRCRGNLP